MLNLISNELLKVRTIRTPWIILAVQQILIVAGISGMVMSGFNMRQSDAQRILLSHAGMSSLFVLILGILAVAGEYRDGTITDTLLATPRRARVIVAKLVTYMGLGLISGIMSAASALAIAFVWYNAKGVGFDFNDDVRNTLTGVIVWMPLYAAIGVGLGTVVSNVGGAITVALAWIALVEGIMISLVGDLGRWLPMASGMALGNVKENNLLPQLTGGLVLAGYAALFAVAATVTITRRDVA